MQLILADIIVFFNDDHMTKSFSIFKNIQNYVKISILVKNKQRKNSITCLRLLVHVVIHEMFLQPVRLLNLQNLLDSIHIVSYCTVWYRTINTGVIML